MKAYVLDRYGKNTALRLADVPEPPLRDDEVLVEVHTAGVNLLDSKIKHGKLLSAWWSRSARHRSCLCVRRDQRGMANVESGRAKGKVLIKLK